MVGPSIADGTPQSEAERVNGIAARANAYDAAYLAAKEPALNALPKEGDAQTQLGRRLAEMNKRDVEVVPAEVAARWAELDTHNFKQLKSQAHIEDAAAVMADNRRNNPDYDKSLKNKEPEVADEVERLDSDNAAKSNAKEIRKQQEAAEAIAERTATAKAWTPEEATRQAQLDAAAFKAERDNNERQYMAGDMAANARHSPAYKVEIEKSGPEVAPFVKAAEPARTRADDAIELSQRQHEATTNAVVKEEHREPAKGPNKVESDEMLTAKAADAVPDDVAKRYVKVGSRFYEANNPKQLAFEDKGNRLETRSNGEQQAQDLVRIAIARGWDNIKVDGSESFRRAAFLEATKQGLHVKGYEPTEQDKAEVIKRAERSPTLVEDPRYPAKTPPSAVEREGAEVTLKVERTTSGFRVRENVAEADQEKVAARNNEVAAKRAEAFKTERQADALRKHPELAGAYGKLQVVQAMMAEDAKADPRLATLEARAIVSAAAKQRVGDRIAAGEIPETRIKTDFERLQQVEKEREASR